MTDLHFEVPVVAHRVFGMRLVTRASRIRPRFPDLGFDAIGDLESIEFDPAFSRTASTVQYPAIDREHGSTMSVEAIRAIFKADHDIAGSDGFTVNTIWEPFGIKFVLLGIVDEVIESHLADLLPNDTRIYKSILRSISENGRVFRKAVHLIFFRELEGRVGQGDVASKYDSAWILLPDFRPFGEETPAQNWRRWLRTTGHEFGHVLKLPHMPDNDNIMWAFISREPPIIKATQMRIAQEAASSYAMPSSVPEIAPYLGVEERYRLRR